MILKMEKFIEIFIQYFGVVLDQILRDFTVNLIF